MNQSSIAAENTDELAVRARNKITRRLMPFLICLFIVAFIDRVNLGYAALEMTKDLSFNPEIFGFGAGIFSSDIFFSRFPEHFWLKLGAHENGWRESLFRGEFSPC